MSVRSFGTVNGISNDSSGLDTGAGYSGKLNSALVTIGAVGGYTSVISQTTSESAGSGIYRTPTYSASTIFTVDTSSVKTGLILQLNETGGTWALDVRYSNSIVGYDPSYISGGTGIYLASTYTGEEISIIQLSSQYFYSSLQFWLENLTAFWMSPGVMQILYGTAGVTGNTSINRAITAIANPDFFKTTVTLKMVVGGNGTTYPYAYYNNNSHVYSIDGGFDGDAYSF